MKVIVENNESKERLVMESVDWYELAPHGTHTLIGSAEEGASAAASASPDVLLTPTAVNKKS